jgi:chorismate mutase
MPPNNSNSTSALSRQMQHLRRQVDRIDLKILRLLQQRTKLSTRIGKAKRQHRAVIYVPERERELFARATRLSKGKLPAPAATSIYREILSSSRAAQGQAPIGLLQAGASAVLAPGRWYFGACDQFLPKKTWNQLAAALVKGSLALALLTGADLARLLATPKGWRDFSRHFNVVGDFPPAFNPGVPLDQRIFIVTPRGKGASCQANRILILIKCKSTVNAVKSLLNSMPDRPIHAEQLRLRVQPAREETVVTLARLTWSKLAHGIRLTSELLTARKLAGLDLLILGVYPDTENYGG